MVQSACMQPTLSDNSNYICFWPNNSSNKTILRPPWTVSETTWVSQYQKGKTSLDLLELEIASGSDISWAICKYAPRPSQITTPASHHSVFTGRMPFLLPNQQRQSTEGKRQTAATSRQVQIANITDRVNNGF